MSEQIERGNDEVAFWIRGTGKENQEDIFIAVSMLHHVCPLCKYNNRFESFKDVYKHFIAQHFGDGQNKDQFYNKIYAILQQLVKFEVNNNRRYTFNKRSEVVYTLNKVHGLPIGLIQKVLGIYSITRTMKMSYRGLILCNSDESIPVWIKNVTTIYS